MNSNTASNQTLLEGICRRGVLISTSVRYWRGCKRLNAEDLGLDPAHVSDRLIQLGHKRLIPRDALSAFALIESRVNATVEGSSFPFLGGIARFVPNARLGDLTDRLDRLRDEFREATLDFVAGYGPLRDAAMLEWREAALNLNGSAERLIHTIEQSFPPAGDITKRFAFETRLFQIAAPDSIRLEVAEGVEQMEIAEDRRRIADDASRRLQSDIDGFIRESVASMREETARLTRATVPHSANESDSALSRSRTIEMMRASMESIQLDSNDSARPKVSGPAMNTADVAAFARFLVLRMVHARRAAVGGARAAHLHRIASKIIHKLEGDTLTPRDISRKTSKLSVSDCRDALDLLLRAGVVHSTGDKWTLNSSAAEALNKLKNARLTIDV